MGTHSIMGHITFCLILSCLKVILMDEPFTHNESSNSVENKRVERSQSPYGGTFTAFNQPAGNPYKLSVPVQKSAPVYRPYANSFTFNVTEFDVPLYEPETEVVYSTTTEISIPDKVAAARIVTTSVPTTTTKPEPTFEEIFGFSLAERTRKETDVLRTIFTYLSENNNTAGFVNEAIETNPCVNSLEELMGLIERGGSILEDVGPDIELMYFSLTKLRNERKVSPLIRGSAKLLLQFETVFPKLQTFSLFTRCQASSDGGLQSLRDQAQILYRMSLVSDPKFTKELKDSLFKSAIITEVATNFLNHLQENLATRDCFTGSDFLRDGTTIAAQVMEDLAEGLGVLGFLPMAQETRQYAAFTRSIVENLEKLEDFKILDDCSPGALSRAAENLISLATIIEESGLEELGVNLGLVFRVDLLP